MGKRLRRPRAAPEKRKHPHGRGEEQQLLIVHQPDSETPPRAWGRGSRNVLHTLKNGNTPTGVGKRSPDFLYFASNWKHPPRAWGRAPVMEDLTYELRNTPTGVGKRAHSNFKQFEYYSIFFSFVKEPSSVCADFPIISCSPDMDVKSFVGMPFA